MLRATLRDLFPDYHHLVGDDEITAVAQRTGWDIFAASNQLNVALCRLSPLTCQLSPAVFNKPLLGVPWLVK
jgi:hypothetical protein